MLKITNLKERQNRGEFIQKFQIENNLVEGLSSQILVRLEEVTEGISLDK